MKIIQRSNPVNRSKTNRRTRVQDAKRHLAAYGRLLKYEGTEFENPGDRVLKLLWAEAMIQRALALETRGRLGDFTATPKSLTAGYTKDVGE